MSFIFIYNDTSKWNYIKVINKTKVITLLQQPTIVEKGTFLRLSIRMEKVSLIVPNGEVFVGRVVRMKMTLLEMVMMKRM